MKKIGKKTAFKCFTALIVLTILTAASNLQALSPQTYEIMGVDKLYLAEPNLTGEAVEVCVVERSESYDGYQPLMDYLPDTAHAVLKNARIDIPNRQDEEGGISFHSTAICSILAGNAILDGDAGENFEYRGPLKDAKITVLEFWQFIEAALLEENTITADVLSASFGTALPNWWTRAMQLTSARENIVAVAGIGNGSEVFKECLYPAAGANFIAVGTVDREMMPKNDSYWLPERTAGVYGKTGEGLLKPDVVAPGNYLAADARNGGFIETGDYTSYAAPAVAAVAGLLIQEAKDAGLKAAYNSDASNCLIKSILMSSAEKGAAWHKGEWNVEDDYQSPLDAKQGSGIINAEAAYRLLKAGELEEAKPAKAGWANTRIDGKTEDTYIIETDPQDAYISATLVWNRNYDSEFPFEYLPEENINLRLELWAISPDNPSKRRLVDYSDSRESNVEHIFCPIAGEEAIYELIVVFSGDEDASKLDAMQRYAIAFTTTQMPKQWKGQWLDYDGDGKLTIKDLNRAIKIIDNDGEKGGIAEKGEVFKGISILLNELAKTDRLRLPAQKQPSASANNLQQGL